MACGLGVGLGQNAEIPEIGWRQGRTDVLTAKGYGDSSVAPAELDMDLNRAL